MRSWAKWAGPGQAGHVARVLVILGGIEDQEGVDEYKIQNRMYDSLSDDMGGGSGGF
jgi:hypothetical protein